MFEGWKVRDKGFDGASARRLRMASGNGKRRSRAAGRRSGATKKSPRVDLDAVREKTTKLVASRAHEMAKSAATEIVKSGNVTGMKYLFEMIGLFGAGD